MKMNETPNATLVRRWTLRHQKTALPSTANIWTLMIEAFVVKLLKNDWRLNENGNDREAFPTHVRLIIFIARKPKVGRYFIDSSKCLSNYSCHSCRNIWRWTLSLCFEGSSSRKGLVLNEQGLMKIFLTLTKHRRWTMDAILGFRCQVVVSTAISYRR